MSTKEELKQKREQDARKRYHRDCRKLIAYQIDEYKQQHLWSYGKHLDHSKYSFALIVDTFRECLQKWQCTNALPKLIIEYSRPAAMFREFHELFAKEKV